MGQTMTEKILSRAFGSTVQAGEYVEVAPDQLMAHDGNRPIVTDVMLELGFERPKHPDRLVIVLDHGVPAPNDNYANVQARLTEFAAKHGVRLSGQGEGISHVTLPEHGHVHAGTVFVASDSHTTTYGAFNCLSTGVGATDLAVAIETGKIWLRVPAAIQVVLKGELRPGVFARDIALELLRRHGTSFARYRAVEYAGDGIGTLDMDGRQTLTNNAIEFGAKFGVMPFDAITATWLDNHGQDDHGTPTTADADANYEQSIEIDLSTLPPLVAAPHSPGNVVPVEELRGTRVDQGFIGTCSNGRLSDLREAAQVLDGQHLAPHQRLIIVPGSRMTYLNALEEGIVDTLARSGAMIGTSGCGPCAGVHGGVPGNGQNVIATAPRNFRGRMGNPNSNVYLASPATVAASALAGEIVPPPQYGKEMSA